MSIELRKYIIKDIENDKYNILMFTTKSVQNADLSESVVALTYSQERFKSYALENIVIGHYLCSFYYRSVGLII